MPINGYPKLCSVAEGIEEVFQSHATSLHEKYKAARRILKIQAMPGGLSTQNWVES